MGELGKNEGFKTPEGYFGSLSDQIKDRMEDESLDLPRKEGFQVPDGYFDSLEQKILSKVDQREPKVIKLYPFKKLVYTAVSIAAVFLIFIGLQWQEESAVGFEDIASLDLEAYFEDNTTGLSSYEIAEVLPVEDLEMSDILEDEWSEENIVDYLDDTIDDIDELNLNNDE